MDGAVAAASADNGLYIRIFQSPFKIGSTFLCSAGIFAALQTTDVFTDYRLISPAADNRRRAGDILHRCGVCRGYNGNLVTWLEIIRSLTCQLLTDCFGCMGHGTCPGCGINCGGVPEQTAGHGNRRHGSQTECTENCFHFK